MITLSVQICGGLGNQLFQIFCLISHSKKLNCNYVIHQLEKSPSITPRNTYWNKLFQNVNLKRDINLYFDSYNEKNNMIFENLPNFSRNTKLNGYFQSEKYLSNIRKEIFEFIKLEENDSQKVLNIFRTLRQKANGKSLIFIHVRRGDYLNLSHVHYNLTNDYYTKSLSNFKEEDSHFVIFSDDIEYCKHLFKNLSYKDFIDLEDYLCLILMSYLDGAIISNSTFSWWGAYLLELRKEIFNENPPKIIQPVRWFTQGSLLPNDRIIRRNNWIVVE